MSRIVVMGWTSPRVSSDPFFTDFYSWDTLEDDVNLKDYDIWVLLPDTLQEYVSRESAWNLLTTEYVYDALLHNTTIFVVGDPRSEVRLEGWGKLEFLHWVGLSIDWDSAKSTLQFADNQLLEKYKIRKYLTKKEQWDYAIDTAQEHQGLRELPPLRLYSSDQTYRVKRSALTLNRYNRQIASELRLDLMENSDHLGWHKVKSFGTILLLPGNDSEVENYLSDFLREALDVSLKEEIPPWGKALVAPNQSEIDSQIDNFEKQQRTLENEISHLIVQRNEARACLEVLYQIGPPLEKSVISMLQELGGTIELPEEANREDGWLSVNISTGTLEAVLEIKGSRKGQFDSYGLKQLLEWVNRGIELRTKKYKPIFIGNSSPKINPEDREFPFADNWIKQAQLANVAAIATTTLFAAYVHHKNGRLDRELFWKNFFETSGVFGEENLPLLPIDFN